MASKWSLIASQSPPANFLFRLAPIGSLFAGYIFMDQFIFRYILEHFFSCKRKLHFVYEHIWSIKHEKGKVNVIKRSVGFAD